MSQAQNPEIDTSLESVDPAGEQFLMFAIGEYDYGVEISKIFDIIGIQTITPVPGVPENIRGIINLRGTIVPVIDVRLRFHQGAHEYNPRTCIIVVALGSLSVGLIVDEVQEVMKFTPEELIEPPEKTEKSEMMGQQFLRNICYKNGKAKLIIDVQQLLLQGGLTEMDIAEA